MTVSASERIRKGWIVEGSLMTWRLFLFVGLLALAASGCGDDAGVNTVVRVEYAVVTESGGTMLEWSPDGERIAFVREGELWTIPPAGGEPTEIISGSSPAWSPDGGSLAYHKQGLMTSMARVYVMTNSIPPDSLLAYGGNPDWSPDGGAIALDHFTWWEWPVEELLIIPAAGGDTEQIVGFGQHPDWSPDGNRIAFCTQSCNRLGIWTACPDGDSLLQLTTEYHWSPRWSPNGKWIAYHAYYDWQLYVIPAGGGLPIHITGGPETKAWPAWSPDGDRLAFSSYNEETGEWEIWIASNLPF
jgi:Tol biopolymer transport system component